MDFSALPTDICGWCNGATARARSNIKRESGENLNGLREPFIDIIPYAPLFQQFLT